MRGGRALVPFVSVVRRHSTAQHSTALVVVVVVVGRSTFIKVVEHSHVFFVVVCEPRHNTEYNVVVVVVVRPSRITSSCDGRGGVSPTQGFEEDCFWWEKAAGFVKDG